MAASVAPCPTCLTRGRAMLPLRDAARAYTMLLVGKEEDDKCDVQLWDMQVCWECHRLFSRIMDFQEQVLAAKILLENSMQMEKYSLSKLSSFTKLGFDLNLEHEDYSTEWLDEEYLSSDIKDEEEVDEPVSTENKNPTTDLISEIDDRAFIEMPSTDRNTRKRKASNTDKILKESKIVLPKMGNTKPQRKKRKVLVSLGERSVVKTLIALPMKGLTKKDQSKLIPKNVIPKTHADGNDVYTVAMCEEDMLKCRASARSVKKFVQASYKCADCILVFSSQQVLERHCERYHDEKQPYQCEVCKKCFGTIYTLSSHMRNHYRLHVCRKCQYTHTSIDNVKTHYDKMHLPGDSYVCAKCDMTFKTRRHLKFHKNNVHKNNHQCNICQKKFTCGSTLRVHMQIHTGFPTVRCTICGTQCRGKQGLYNHMVSVHKKSEKVAYCVDCDKHYATDAIYRQHLRKSERHIAPVQLKHPCTKCHKKFTSAGDLRQHDRQYHLDYTCPICKKKLANYFSLNKHKLYVHEKKEMPRKHVCEVCGMGFKSSGNLKKHRVVHTGERPFSCDICNATFTQNSSLGTHLKQSHMNKKRKVKSKRLLTNNPSKLWFHKTGVHKNNFQCPTCEKIVMTAHALQAHIQMQLTRHNVIHTGERPYECNL